jgi:hypothetical protein
MNTQIFKSVDSGNFYKILDNIYKIIKSSDNGVLLTTSSIGLYFRSTNDNIIFDFKLRNYSNLQYRVGFDEYEFFINNNQLENYLKKFKKTKKSFLDLVITSFEHNLTLHIRDSSKPEEDIFIFSCNSDEVLNAPKLLRDIINRDIYGSMFYINKEITLSYFKNNKDLYNIYKTTNIFNNTYEINPIIINDIKYYISDKNLKSILNYFSSKFIMTGLIITELYKIPYLYLNYDSSISIYIKLKEA